MRRVDAAAGWLTLLALATGGCSLAPAERRPAIVTPVAYKEAAGWQTAGTGVPPAGKWWQAFDDATLSALEERIEGGNFTLAAAVARYDQARELVRQAQADRYPQVTAGAKH